MGFLGAMLILTRFSKFFMDKVEVVTTYQCSRHVLYLVVMVFLGYILGYTDNKLNEVVRITTVTKEILNMLENVVQLTHGSVWLCQ